MALFGLAIWAAIGTVIGGLAARTVTTLILIGLGVVGIAGLIAVVTDHD